MRLLLRGLSLLVLMLLIPSTSAETVLAATPSPSLQLGNLQVTITDLPPLVPADVRVLGSAIHGAPLRVVFTQTLSLPAGQYSISAESVLVRPELQGRLHGSAARTYYPTVTTPTVTVQAGTTAQATVDYRTIAPTTTKVLANTVLSSLVSSTPGYATLVFDASSSLPPLAPGDILVAAVSPQTPYGFLRTVTAVSVQGTQVVVTTSPATLFEAVPRGTIDLHVALTAADLQGAPTAALARSASNGAGSAILTNIKKNLTCTNGSTMTLTGSLSTVPKVDFHAEWGGFLTTSLQKLTSTLTVTETAALTAEASANAQCTLERTALLPIPLTFDPIMFSIGPVPVVIVPQLQIYMNGDGKVEATVTAGVTQQVEATAGVDYANGSFTPVGHVSNSFTYVLPSLSALDASVHGALGPGLTLLLYGVAGPETNIDASMELAVNPLKSPWCSLSADLDAGASLKVPMLDLDYGNPNLLSRTFPVAQCSAPLPSGRITIVQRVVGATPNGDWVYTGDLGNFTLPAAGGSTVFQGLASGSDTLTQTSKAGYASSVTCSDGATGTNSVTVNLTAGELVTCTFTATLAGASLPTVTGIAPSSGPTTGGTSVAITGTGFTSATAVSFGDTAATSFKVNSDTSITATSPAESAGKVDVRVTTPNGVSSLSIADQFAYVTTVWTSTSNLLLARYSVRSVLLPNGAVLIAGGFAPGAYTAESELYAPATGQWTATGSMAQGRGENSMTVLSNGKVLVAGGYAGPVLSEAELYDPATGGWTPTGGMNNVRTRHAAVLLQDGRVLVAGGWNGDATASAEMYAPSSGTWATINPMGTPRQDPAAVVLSSGKVLVAGGGTTGGTPVTSAEIYDPATGVWTATGSMNMARGSFGIALLSNGLVLAAGGGTGSGNTATAELYNPTTGTWALTGTMAHGRIMPVGQVLITLPNGGVLASGGDASATSEVYDATSGMWTSVAPMTQARCGAAVAPLSNGGAIIAAGNDCGSTTLATAQVYTP